MMQDYINTLLKGYFHEDWAEEASNPSEVLDDFVSAIGLTGDELQRLTNDLLALATQHEGDNEGWLFRDLGCYFDPSADGQTDAEWLRDLARQLIAKKGLAPQ